MSDVFQSAVNAAENRGHYYGKLQVEGQYVVFQKGIGKLSYNEGQHDPKDRRTEISLILSPIDEMGITTLITRSVIAESDEWSRIVWPAMRDGCKLKSPRDASGQFVKVQMVENGRKWTDKTGQERTGTAMKLLVIYPNEAACKAAFADDGNQPRTPTVEDSATAAMAVDMTPNVANPERQTALAFLPSLVKAANGSKDQLANLIAGMPVISKWFTVDSPEVVTLLGTA